MYATLFPTDESVTNKSQQRLVRHLLIKIKLSFKSHQYQFMERLDMEQLRCSDAMYNQQAPKIILHNITKKMCNIHFHYYSYIAFLL